MKSIVGLFVVIMLLLPVGMSLNAQVQVVLSEDEGLPTQFSWRNIDGIDYTTSIRDQSPAPTCEAYALCASLETKMQYQLQEIYNPDLSDVHLYFYAGGTYEKGYVNIIDAANYLKHYGVPDEGCFPDPHRAFDYPYESLEGWEERTVKITQWGWVAHDVTAMKQALIDHGPLILCMYFWRDFYYYFGGVYMHQQGQHAGGHVVTIVGYDDEKSCWIVKNSWGTRWGEAGWFRLAYEADVIAEWYGPGTGVMYIEGVYGNLKPDVPKIYLDAPDYYQTYVFGKEFPTLIRKLPFQVAASRIIGKLTVHVTTENTESVEFFLDGISQAIDTEEPFSWQLTGSRGLHTLMVKATDKNGNASLDVQDIHIIFL